MEDMESNNMADMEKLTQVFEKRARLRQRCSNFSFTKNKTALIILLSLLLFVLIVALVGVSKAGNTNDGPLPQIEHGSLICEGEICFLKCNSGYVGSINRPITCNSQSKCFEALPQLKCFEAVALVIGGATHQDIWNDVELYSPSGDCNKLLPVIPESRSSHTSQLIDTSVITCGGHQHNIKSTCIVLHLDDIRQEWKQHSTMLRPRDDHSSIISMGKLYLLGGSGLTASKTSDIWNGKSWSLGPQTPDAGKLNQVRFGDSCIVGLNDTSFIVTGGFYTMRETWLFHAPSSNWNRLPDMIKGRRLHGCIMIQNDNMNGVLVAGGKYVFKSTEYLDMNVNPWKWVMMENMVEDRHSFGLVTIGGEKGYVLALAGWGNAMRLSSVEILEKNTWSIVNISLKNAKSSFSVVAVPKTVC